MSTAQTQTPFLSADEFWRLPDNGQPRELVRGRIVMMSRPGFRHGWLCNRIGCLLGEFVNARQLGYVVNNDSGVITEEDPDTVRGPDVAYYSYERVPKDQPPPEGYPEVARRAGLRGVVAKRPLERGVDSDRRASDGGSAGGVCR